MTEGVGKSRAEIGDEFKLPGRRVLPSAFIDTQKAQQEHRYGGANRINDEGGAGAEGRDDGPAKDHAEEVPAVKCRAGYADRRRKQLSRDNRMNKRAARRNVEGPAGARKKRQHEQEFDGHQTRHHQKSHCQRDQAAGHRRYLQLDAVAVPVGGRTGDGSEKQRRDHIGGAHNAQPGKGFRKLPGYPLDGDTVDPHPENRCEVRRPIDAVVSACEGAADAAGQVIQLAGPA